MRLNISLTIAILVLLMFGRGGYGQNCPSGTQPLPPPLTKQNAANSWRFVGVDPAKQTDTVDPAIRQARTAFWAKTLHDFAPRPDGFIPGPPIGSILGTVPEFPKSPGELWITGTFVNYDVFPIPSIRLAYTEIHFLIQSVISQNPPVGLAPGKIITIGLAGGTLLEDNKPVSRYLRPRKYALKPGHTYLLQLLVDPDTDFFLAGRNWDITSGVAVPNDYHEVVLDRAGKSQIDGTPASQIVARMKAILAAR